MNPDSKMGQIEQDKGGLNLTPEINPRLQDTYLFRNATDDNICSVRTNNEITSDDLQVDIASYIGNNNSVVKFDHNSTTTQQQQQQQQQQQLESYDNDNSHIDNDLYPPTDTPPQSLTANPSPISQRTAENSLHPPSTTTTTTNSRNEGKLHATPPINITSIDNRNVTSDNNTNLTSPVGRACGGGQQRGNNRKPSIYSAIGSLEDPLSSSFKGWDNDKDRKSVV